MSTFTWDAGANQMYDEIYGSQTVHGSTFNKDYGKSFIMNAPDETLTLRYHVKSADDIGGVWQWGIGNSDNRARETLINVLQGKLVFNGLNANASIPGILNASIMLGYAGYPPPHIRIESDSELHLINLLSFSAAERSSEEKSAQISLLDSAKLVVNHEDDTMIFNMVIPLSAVNDAKANIDVQEFIVYEAIELKDRADASLTCKKFELMNQFIRVTGEAKCSLKAETATAAGSFILDEGSGRIVIEPNSKGECPFDFREDESLTTGLFDFIHSGKAANNSVLTMTVKGFNKTNLIGRGFFAINGEPLSEQEVNNRFLISNTSETNKWTFRLRS
jgi:hypothetical protein